MWIFFSVAADAKRRGGRFTTYEASGSEKNFSWYDWVFSCNLYGAMERFHPLFSRLKGSLFLLCFAFYEFMEKGFFFLGRIDSLSLSSDCFSFILFPVAQLIKYSKYNAFVYKK